MSTQLFMFQDPKVEQVEKLLKDYLLRLDKVSVISESREAFSGPPHPPNQEGSPLPESANPD